MPKLDYTNDLRNLAGQTNDASQLTDNLTDVQTRGRALDWENVARGSLDASHVYDPGGGAPEPLRDGESGFVATVAVAPAGWVDTTSSIAFTGLIANISRIYIVYGLRFSRNLGFIHNMRLFDVTNGAAVDTRTVGPTTEDYGAAFGCYAEICTAAAQTYRVEAQASGGAPTAEYVHITGFAIHR